MAGRFHFTSHRRPNFDQCEQDNRQMLVDDFKKMGLLRQLEKVEIAAKVAKQRVDKSLLKARAIEPSTPQFYFSLWPNLEKPD